MKINTDKKKEIDKKIYTDKIDKIDQVKIIIPYLTDREIWILQNWINEQLQINKDLPELKTIYKKLDLIKNEK